MLLYARAHHWMAGMYSWCGATLVLMLFMPSSLVIPFQSEGLTIRTALLVPVLGSVAILPTLVTPVPELQQLLRSRSRLGRLIQAGFFCVCIAAYTGAIFGSSGSIGLKSSILRNLFFCVGAMLLFSRIFSLDVAWSPVVTFTGGCFVFGTDLAIFTPRRWAFLLLEFSGSTLALGATVLVAGLLVFVLWGPRAPVGTE